MQRAATRCGRGRIAAKINYRLRKYRKYLKCVSRRLRIVRRKRAVGKQIIHSANDVIRSANIPSSMAVTVDEEPDRYMRYESKPVTARDTLFSIKRYRIDDLYEAIDY